MNEHENPPRMLIGPGVITSAILSAYVPLIVSLHVREVAWLWAI